MNKNLCRLAVVALAITAGCGGSNLGTGPVPPVPTGITESNSISQNAATNPTASPAPSGTDVQGVVRSSESTAAGYLTGTFLNLPPTAQPNVAVVFANGTSQPLARGTTLRLIGTVTIVAVNSILPGGDVYVPTPPRQVKTVYGNSRTNVVISYAPLPPGNLNINSTGLPSGASLNLTITGPNNWGTSVFRAGVLQNLKPGPYVVTAQSVTFGGKTYVPNPSAQNVVVNSNTTTTAGITYTYTAATSWFSPQTMMNVAQTLARNVTRYGQDLRTGTTYCNIFVREFVSNLVGFNPPELAGRVADQLAAISTSPRWREFTNKTDWNWTYAEATRQVQAGHIVIVVTTYQDSHIAAVMPNNLVLGWGTRVPVIAEATVRNRSAACSAYGKDGVDSAAPLSCGFYSWQQQSLRFFVYNP